MSGLKLLTIITISAIAVVTLSCSQQKSNSSLAINQEQPSRKVKFVCHKTYEQDSDTYVYSTIAWNSANKKPIIIWKRQDFSGNNYPPQTRCEEVSPRFQQAYDSGSFKYITHGEMNGQPVICTSSTVGGNCQTLLITLKHEDNTEQTLEQLSDILLGYASSALEQSSGDISYSEDNRLYIEVDLDDFLSQP